jgi:hypothetical protein
MMSTEHLATALRHVQSIVETASREQPPITVREALEQIEEELDLAGFGLAASERRDH